ncbi:N-acetylglucosamine-6-phosphate deacetylase [Thermotoga sp.]|uniref:N-acetylglucosamine-6-phosphate deacetylase n=1 Tax=Thermotoga sp. TaxID=28240 RepID=UPI0025EF2F63|nr:N-acetylglucosamine-6-phosphate deacetylase [Thermotoga sp.]MCD6551880.1 N-acetylglucosamine-6-phosphate deacetylase [Thermotoga sp.]
MILSKLLIVDPIDGEFTGDIEIEEGKIVFVRKKDYATFLGILVPGFVDPHIHGCAGADTLNGEFERMEEFQYAQGVTTFFATTVSISQKKIKEVIEKAKNYIKAHENTSLEGVHMEGPYISREKAGAHNTKYIRPPTREEIEDLSFPVRIMTFAPEVEDAEILLKLQSKGIVLSVGHSMATFNEYMNFYKRNVKRITHFPNGLRALHHREIGVTGAALLKEDVTVELICDGVHLAKEMVKLVYRVKGPAKIALITDSISAAGLKDGEVQLGDLRVKVKDGIPRLSNGTLAGSTLTFSSAVRNFKKFTGAPLRELAMVASYNSCIELGLNDRGRIKEGKKADLVLLDRELNVLMTIKGGEIVYRTPNSYFTLLCN